MKARLAVFGAVALGLFACGGPGAKAPVARTGDLPGAFAGAFQVEANGDPRAATAAYLDVVRTAAALEGDPWQVPALEASLDALATRSMPELGEASSDAALAWRTADPGAIVQALSQVDSHGVFARSLVAHTLQAMAERRGDAADAERQRVSTGCVREAVVLGPTTWAPITGVEEAGPLDHADAKLAAAYPRGDAFGTAAHPLPVHGDGCDLPLAAESAKSGVREVVVDVEVPSGGVVGFALRAHGAAVLHAGGNVVLRRPFELGTGEAVRFARVTAAPGTLRVVARVGSASEDDTVELDVLGEDGAPL
ncbi:MAG TPA: hypothetical protein VIY73_19330, partial [Polyangiaceae bacterium]